jgi:Transposase DDE domain group 1
LARFIAFLDQIGYAGQVQTHLPWRLTSPNPIPPGHTPTALLTFRACVTNRTESPLESWRDYHQRACVEQRIEEVKNDLSAQVFCTQNFWETEAAFVAVLFTFNLLSLCQQQVSPQQEYRQSATLRAEVFVCGAILGRSDRQMVLQMSVSWGELPN